MEVRVPKETKISIPPELLILNQVQERLDVKPAFTKITWTDQTGTERKITALTDGHISNLVAWLRERDMFETEKIINGELERRCTGKYPEWFESVVNEYKNCPETWRLKVY